MTLILPVAAQLGAGTVYRKSFVTPQDEYGIQTGFFTANIRTTADLQNAANSFPDTYGNEASMPKRTVDVAMIGGGQAIGTARYHRRGIKPTVRWVAGTQQMPVWTDVDGELNKEYDKNTGAEAPKQRIITVVLITFFWETTTDDNPVTTQLLNAMGKVNSNVVNIQGQGAVFTFQPGYLLLEAPEGAEYVWGTVNHYDAEYSATYSSAKWQYSYLAEPASAGEDPIPMSKNLYEAATFPTLA